MVGIEIFSKYFKDYRDCYIVIGGVACEDHFQEEGLEFRATKDIDMILVVEALNDSFISLFWKFIKDGKYGSNQIGEHKRQYYRFINPTTENFPMQIELFSRTPDGITRTSEMELTPIPTNEEMSSLSAILMDDEYYSFTIKNSSKGKNIHRADDLALICLKAKAFLDLTNRKESGETIDSKNIKKHKNDVFRLAVTLRDVDNVELPKGIKKDLIKFIDLMNETPQDIKAIMKNMGITAVIADDLLEQIKVNFNLN